MASVVVAILASTCGVVHRVPVVSPADARLGSTSPRGDGGGRDLPSTWWRGDDDDEDDDCLRVLGEDAVA
jgi:hypothetical protein